MTISLHEDALPVSRRALVRHGAVLAASCVVPVSAIARDTGRTAIELLAGTYRAEHGGGLYPIAFTPRGDRWTQQAPLGAIANASFAVHSRRRDLYYILDERSDGRLDIWRADPAWKQVGSVPTAGADPCHMALDAGERGLAVANYSSGTVAFYALDPATGLPAGSPIVRANSGAGPDRDRQSGPHAHWVGFAPAGRWLHSVDLGTDQVLSYALGARGDDIGPAFAAYRGSPGSGPRHLAFHPTRRTAYLVSELANTITVLACLPDGRFSADQTISTLPAGFAGRSQAAHIALDRAGTRLYVSNRGHDSIAVFAIDAHGRLALLQHLGTQGAWPRFFLLLEDHGRLLVANQRSGTITACHVAADGRLAPADGHAAVPGVAFIMHARP